MDPLLYFLRRLNSVVDWVRVLVSSYSNFLANVPKQKDGTVGSARYARRRDDILAASYSIALPDHCRAHIELRGHVAINLPSTYITNLINAKHKHHALVGPPLRQCGELCCRASKDKGEYSYDKVLNGCGFDISLTIRFSL